MDCTDFIKFNGNAADQVPINEKENEHITV